MKLLSLISLLALPVLAQTAYWTTNEAGQAVLYVGGLEGTNTWRVFGFRGSVTNGVAAAGGGGGGGVTNLLDPSTNATLTARWRGSTLSGQGDGSTITSWQDSQSSVLLSMATESVRPTKQTVDGRTVVRFDGTNDYLARAYDVTNWFTCAAGADAGTLLFRCKVVTKSPNDHGLFYWSGSGQVLTAWLPYQTDIYWDWKLGDATGRVSATNPSGLFDTWHNITYRRHTDGSQSIRIDGTNIVSATRTSDFIPGVGTYGDFNVGAVGTTYFKGDIEAILFFNTAITDEQADGYGNWEASQ